MNGLIKMNRVITAKYNLSALSIFRGILNRSVPRAFYRLLCALDRVFDKASVFMMRGPSYRGRELDTYSVEAVPQATKVRGMQPKGV